MKILLIEPAKAPATMAGEDVHIFEPLALEYIAAGVKNDHDVKILDMRLDKNLKGTLENFEPDIVGITAFTVHVNPVRNLFGEIKRLNPGILTVVGGHHATVVPEDFKSPYIDVIVMGEGIFAFKEIAARFEKNNQSFSDIQGIAYKNGEELVKNNSPVTIDLDSCPFPARSLTAEYRKEYYCEWMKPLASIRTSKGCPFRCSFCALWKLTGGKYFKRSPESIVEELGSIDEPFVFFADDESLVDAERMKKLAGLIREAGIKKQYFLYGRSDTIAKNPGLIEAWRAVGLERVFIGLEFFKDSDLEYIKKGSNISDNDRAVKILFDNGVDVYASFIIRPEFDKKDFASLRKYIRNLDLNFASFAILTPLPGTDFYYEVKDRMITDNYNYFDFIHTLLPTKLPMREFYDEYTLMLKKSIPLKNIFPFLMKFRMKEIIPSLGKIKDFYAKLDKIHLDYEEDQNVHIH
ncbi:B12-binding domain-containing radical SAM protein [candidate division KSB1 bacterium]